jgi:AcrR family transcriptional regulator
VGSLASVPVVGLRERKKQQTHERIKQCALRLFAARGYDRVTVHDIADAADIAPRTFFLHYASKEDVLIGDTATRARGFISGLRARPAAESAFEALRTCLLNVVESADMDDEEIRLRARLVDEAPALMASNLEQNAAIAEALAEVLAERTGRDPRRDVYTRVLASAGMTALLIAASIWSRGGAERPLAEIVDEVLNQLATGLAQPVGGSS